jgi:glutathione synthase/RimK-type ligase-like ATP-grasp enzyme
VIAIGVLVPVDAGSLPPPGDRPMARAAATLEGEGVAVIFGAEIHEGRLCGVRVDGERWVACESGIDWAYDRFPSQQRAAHFARLRPALGVPLSNPWSFTLLCRDKVACQRFLEQHDVAMPALATDAVDFAASLDRWGGGFLKPRFGALGAGVRHVLPGDAASAFVAGLAGDEPAILQAPVAPPDGWAGVSIRVLAQREAGGSWTMLEPVVRRSRDDAVVNVSRGADVAAGSDLLAPETQRALAGATARVLGAFDTREDAGAVVELGLDYALDPRGEPHLLEVNGRPQGRLEVLAAIDPTRFGAAHRAAIERPLRHIATLAHTNSRVS